MRKPNGTTRRENALSRDRIIEAAIGLLDDSGEDGLTFQALSKRLATGPGALYWHVANKSDLMIAACDSIIASALIDRCDATPEIAVRNIALAIFDTIDAHPWVGSALGCAPGQMPVVRILEPLGRQVSALGVPEENHFAAACALLNYILGVGGQNAANAQFARDRGFERSNFLGEVATAWEQLDPDLYPFSRGIAKQMANHDDRVDFLTGINYILAGMIRS